MGIVVVQDFGLPGSCDGELLHGQSAMAGRSGGAEVGAPSSRRRGPSSIIASVSDRDMKESPSFPSTSLESRSMWPGVLGPDLLSSLCSSCM